MIDFHIWLCIVRSCVHVDEHWVFLGRRELYKVCEVPLCPATLVIISAAFSRGVNWSITPVPTNDNCYNQAT